MPENDDDIEISIDGVSSESLPTGIMVRAEIGIPEGFSERETDLKASLTINRHIADDAELKRFLIEQLSNLLRKLSEGISVPG